MELLVQLYCCQNKWVFSLFFHPGALCFKYNFFLSLFISFHQFVGNLFIIKTFRGKQEIFKKKQIWTAQRNTTLTLNPFWQYFFPIYIVKTHLLCHSFGSQLQGNKMSMSVLRLRTTVLFITSSNEKA